MPVNCININTCLFWKSVYNKHAIDNLYDPLTGNILNPHRSNQRFEQSQIALEELDRTINIVLIG